MSVEFKRQINKRFEILYNRIAELRKQKRIIEMQIRDYLQTAQYYLDIDEGKHDANMKAQIKPEIIEKLESIEFEEIDKSTEEQSKTIHRAVNEVLFESTEPLYITRIIMAVVKKYPDLADQMKYVKSVVSIALVNGVKMDVYKKVSHNIYQRK